MLECIYFFVIGAFIGWLLECVFKFVTKNFSRTPGILNTPFCILYGLGTVILSKIIANVTNNFLLLFILSMITLSMMEYVTFIFLKKIYNIKLWDYTDMKFNIEEKVCLEFSLIWGVLGALYIKYLLPLFKAVFLSNQGIAMALGLYILLGIILVDFIYSSYILIKRKKCEKCKKSC